MGLIVACYIAYLRKHPERHAESIFPMPLARIMPRATLVFFVAILVVLGFAKDSRIALFFAPVWILFMALMYRFLRSTRAEAEPIDFDAERDRARELVEQHVTETGGKGASERLKKTGRRTLD